MDKEYQQQQIDDGLLHSLRSLVQMTMEEDLRDIGDLTTLATVPKGLTGQAAIVSRKSGYAAGFNLIPTILDEFDSDVTVDLQITDGDAFAEKQQLAVLNGTARDLLITERTVLNFLGKLCGIATLAAQFVAKVQGTSACVYETRKTTPGYRRLEKYAARCGGATNHRLGLWHGVLIKDNHLASRATVTGDLLSPEQAVLVAKEFIASNAKLPPETMIEIEVDNLDQLRSALLAAPDIVLLDNMNNDQLRQAVSIRDESKAQTHLEASGGVNLETIGDIAKTGIDRISVGAITHSATNLDLGLDWIFHKKAD